MKKIIILALLALPTFAMAQSEWEIPNQQKQEVKKEKEKKDKSNQKSNSSQHFRSAEPAKEKKVKIDPKYAAGTVPTVDGKVEWDKRIYVPGVSDDNLFARAMEWVTSLTKSKGQLEASRISAVNRREHIIAAHLEEEMVFSNSTFSKDYAEFRYTIVIKVQNSNVDVQLYRMSYNYDMGRSTAATYQAEEWITDRECINKKGTKLYRMNGKFRKGTIDRKDELFDSLQRALRA